MELFQTRAASLRVNVVAVLSLAAASGRATEGPRMRVLEQEVSIALGTDGGTLQLPVDNRGPARPGRLRVEVLGPDDGVRAAIDQSVELPVGQSVLTVRLPARLGEPEAGPQAPLLDRLRFVLEAADGETVAGVRAVSAAATGLLDLRVVGNPYQRAGGTALLRVHATDPRSGEPVAGAELEARVLTAQGSRARGTTDGEGMAYLDLPLPARPLRGPITAEVVARRDGPAALVRSELFSGTSLQALATADKPLYRPGQTLRARVLVLEPHERVMAGVVLQARLVDAAGALAHQAELVTSRHGVATLEWVISERAALGTYRLTFDAPEELMPGSTLASVDVRIGRYELPVFRLEAGTEHRFHLPGQDARAVIRVESLTGEPLSGARVRVVRRDGDRDAEVTSKTDTTGMARVNLDLTADHDNLADDEYRSHTDVGFEAHVTDPVSGRSETRPFDLRVTREPIHVYWRSRAWRDAAELPLDGYVSTYTADGRPVACQVRVSGAETLQATTGDHGLARVRGTRPLAVDRSGDARLQIEAHAAGGRRGRAQVRLHIDEGDVVRLVPERVLLRAGDSVRARVSAKPEADVLVQLWGRSGRLASRRVATAEQGVDVEIPYQPDFSGVLSLTAERLSGAPGDDALDAVGLLYPTGRGLTATLAVEPARARPGREVEARLRLADGQGRPLAGVAGLTGVDRALIERADAEGQSHGFWFEHGLPWDGERTAGFRLADLESLDPAGPFTPDQQLAAEILLGWGAVWLASQKSERLRVEESYRPALARRIAPLRQALAETPWEDLAPRELVRIEPVAAARGVDLSRVEDPWGNPCRPRLVHSRERLVLTLRSGGPDEVPDTADDLEVDVISWRWYARQGQALRRALARHVTRTGRMPRDLAALARELWEAGLDLRAQKDPSGRPLALRLGHRGTTAEIRVESQGSEVWRADAKVLVRSPDWGRSLARWADAHGRLPRDARELRAAGLAPGRLRDPWGGRCRVVFRRDARYVDRLSASGRDASGGPAREVLTPVTESFDVVSLVGAGPDRRPETKDDVTLATFTRVPGPGQVLTTSGSLSTSLPAVVSAARGAVAGFVTDASGAALPGCSVRLLVGEREAGVAVTDANGAYALGDLAPGRYRLTVELSGFKAVVVPEVAVEAARPTAVDVRLELGEVQETVTVSAAPIQASTAATSVSSSRLDRVAVSAPLATPRLREYFPETLLWHPELETDGRGEARVRFRLPDSLTTWSLSALASTDDGRVAHARSETVAFQPFFVQLDPPAHLTVGDRVELPVPVRNHTEADQDVTVVVSRDDALGGGRSDPQRVRVPRAGVAAPRFELRAVEPARHAALTADARSEHDGDRVRRRLEVRPDGESQVALRAAVARGGARLEVDLPADVLPGSAWTELRVVPSLRAHLVAAVEGLLQRPWGCAEQTVSTAFPSLLLLELKRPGDADSPALARAARFLDEAVERLVGYEAGGGGFGYWMGGRPDPAVSAHALRFLARARRVGAAVDERLLSRTRDALVRLQADGAWGEGAGDRRSALLTAQVARALAEAFEPPRDSRLEAALARARAALAPLMSRWDEPYLIASYALLVARLGKAEDARPALARLRALERGEQATAYWDVQTNTPFHGWGTAGRLETTGLALQALERVGDQDDDRHRCDRALLFLLRGQDRHGVWWSTQATVNVLEGLIARLRREPPGSPVATSGEVWLDERLVTTLNWPAGDAVSAPMAVDLGGLSPGRHVVELRGTEDGSASVHLVAGYARPWPAGPARAAGSLRFTVTPDRRELRRGEPVTVTVAVERSGFRGYGMLIAEVGLPPGADVDRASLEQALARTPGFERFEVQPDRVVLYLWPRAGGVTVPFAFRPRFAMEAQAAPSWLWDYYNPEEAVSLPPARFVVH